MERISVQSKDLAIVGYDSKASFLEITFRGGGVYRYMNVPQKVYEELMKAESHGTYFNKNIKDKYTHTKLS